jgi:hypothetical protein
VSRTRSEEIFERFCDEVAIPWVRIPEDVTTTPDYDLPLRRQTIVAEVKQLDPNDEDKCQIRERQEKGYTGGIRIPGKRVRREITDSMGQLRSRAKGRFPALLVLYNNVDVGIRLIDPYDVLTGMYGMEEARFLVPLSIPASR